MMKIYLWTDVINVKLQLFKGKLAHPEYVIPYETAEPGCPYAQECQWSVHLELAKQM